ncbi:MAG TPA: DUF3618 domain-containing protein [Solirubrobacteraceae bacterium]|jgi:hypothetical protein|nr:DUF3618 domain-containing protein [Solirubrobacteraceae bacterium]
MAKRSPDEIRTDIEHTREELGDTVEALAAKTDVKAQAHAKIGDVKQQAKAKADDVKQQAKAKVDEVRHRVDGVRSSGSDGDGNGSAPAVRDSAVKVGQAASQAAARKPVPTAAIGGFLGGLVVGRLMCRRSH